MYSIILFSVLGFLIAIYKVYKKRNAFWFEAWDYLLDIFFGFFIGSIVGIVISFAMPTHYYVAEQSEFHLVSLSESSQTTAKLFLGTGNIDGNACLLFYYKVDSTYHLGNANFSKVVIHYTKSKPVLLIKLYKPSNPFAFRDPKKTYNFYVPPNSIKPNFTLGSN